MKSSLCVRCAGRRSQENRAHGERWEETNVRKMNFYCITFSLPSNTCVLTQCITRCERCMRVNIENDCVNDASIPVQSHANMSSRNANMQTCMARRTRKTPSEIVFAVRNELPNACTLHVARARISKRKWICIVQKIDLEYCTSEYRKAENVAEWKKEAKRHWRMLCTHSFIDSVQVSNAGIVHIYRNIRGNVIPNSAQQRIRHMHSVSTKVSRAFACIFRYI